MKKQNKYEDFQNFIGLTWLQYGLLICFGSGKGSQISL